MTKLHEHDKAIRARWEQDAFEFGFSGEGDAFWREYMEIITKVRLMMRKYKASCELPPAEFHMLSLIRLRSRDKQGSDPGCPGVTTTEIMELQGISISGASKILGAMERKGFISRSPSRRDRRVSYLTVTPGGEEVLRRMIGDRNRVLRRLAERLGEENLRRFMGYIEDLYDVMIEEWEEKEND